MTHCCETDHEIEDAFWHTFDYLQHCAENGIVFNVEKFIFAQETCEYAGFELTPDIYRPPKKVMESISNFPTPKSTTDVRSWFGLINQVAYTFSRLRWWHLSEISLQKEAPKVLLGRRIGKDFQEIKRSHSRYDQRWCVPIRDGKDNLLVNRLVKSRTWIHIESEALQLPGWPSNQDIHSKL